MQNRKGFTLVELMIVVAIIGILASIAIPNFVSMQYRAKRSELPMNVDGIKTSQLAYEASNDGFVQVSSFHPHGTSINKQLVPWTTGSNFDTLGWSPDGDVRGSYATVTTSATDFLVYALSDIDGDSSYCLYMATKSTNAELPSTSYQRIY